jgi:DNA-binding NarL/FixJ family response regulator
MVRTSPLLAPEIIGRTRELEVLRAGLEGAGAGHGSTVVVVGEAGIGKSRLLREVRTWCSELGAVALVGRCVETATTIPFRPLAEALLAACRSGPLDADPEVLPFRGALRRLVPDGTIGEAAPSDAPGAPLLHVAEAFLRVARARGRAGRGTAVLLDDLQWVDAETLAAVEYLADNLESEPVLLVAASRPVAGRTAPGLSALADRRVATLLELSRLGPEDTATMTRGCLGDAAVPAQVLALVEEQAEGLPFLVEELLAGLRSDGVLIPDGDGWAVHPTRGHRPPPTFHESVRSRMRALTPEHRRVLGDAALLGRTVDRALVAAMTEAGPIAVDAAIHAALEVTLLQTFELGVRFRHAMTRDALLADLSASDRMARSRRALAALGSVYPELPDDLTGVAADLAEAVGDASTAVTLLLAQARQALARGALTSAENALRRALALVGDGPSWPEVTVPLVTTLGLAGRVADAFTTGEAVLARLGADGSGDPDGAQRLEVHLALARAASAATDWTRAAGHLTRARALPAGADVAAVARLDALDANVALGRYRVDDAARLAASAVAAAEQAGDPDLLCEALLVHGRCLRTRRLGLAIRVFRRCADVAEAAGLAHREARALTELGFVYGYRDADDRVLLTARSRARACGAPETEAVAENALAGIAWCRADADAVASHTDAGLALARRYRLGQLEPALLVCAAAGRALRADTVGMEALLTRADALGDEPMERIAALAQARATCAFATDDLHAAAHHLAAAAELARVGAATAVVPMLALHPVVLAAAGADVSSVEVELRDWDNGASRLIGGMLGAATAIRAGRSGTAAVAALERALANLDVAPFLQAVVARLAATAAEKNGWGDPSSWLAAAHATFVGLGLPAPAAGCAAALRRLQPPGPRPGALTPREEDVLTLVEQGLPNRAIAERLFLSARTVEKHVERLLAKTGQANRTQLASYARRRGQAAEPADTAST